MTVRRAQVILSQLRKYKRGFNPDTDRMALQALGDVEKAVKNDIRAVTGKTVGTQLDNLDYHYARQMGDSRSERWGKRSPSRKPLKLS